MNWLPAFLSFFLLAVSLAAPATVTIAPGTAPSVVEVGVEFGPLTLRVTDSSGGPVAGARVSWVKNSYLTNIRTVDPQYSVCPFDPLSHCEMTTGGDGSVTLPRMYAAITGNHTLAFRALLPVSPFTELGTAVLAVTAVPMSRPPTLSVIGGGGQKVAIDAAFPAPMSVQFRDFEGNPLAGRVVTFNCCKRFSESSLTFAGPTDTYEEVFTDASGIAVTPPLIARKGIGEGFLLAFAAIPGAHGFVRAEIPFVVTTPGGRTEVSIQDMWWPGFNENGWGISIAQHGDRLFSVLYSYDVTGRPTWRVMPTGKWVDGLRYSVWGTQLFTTRGTPYFAYDASRLVVETQPRHSAMHFDGADRGALYVVNAVGTTEKRIQRQDYKDEVNPAPLRGLADMWWGGPSQNGWGIAIMEQPGSLFSVWLTYDVDGAPFWFVMPTGRWTATDTFEGTLYRTRGPSWPNYDKSQLEVIAAGTFRYRFHSLESASFDYLADGNTGTLSLVRQPF